MHYLTSLYMNGLVTCNDMGYSTLLIEINVKKLISLNTVLGAKSYV